MVLVVYAKHRESPTGDVRITDTPRLDDSSDVLALQKRLYMY